MLGMVYSSFIAKTNFAIQENSIMQIEWSFFVAYW